MLTIKMKVKDLIKTIIIASANDSCVALAEHICGSVEGFVEKKVRQNKYLWGSLSKVV